MTALTTLPAGRYFVGDPCYAIPDEKWMDFLEAGTFAGNAMIAFKGGFAGCVNTEYGDGTYEGYGKYTGPFPVDAGLLGAVSENLIEGDVEELKNLGMMVEFEAPFEIHREGTVVMVGHIAIETGFSSDEEEDAEDDWFERDVE